jgi:hypothetical protein
MKPEWVRAIFAACRRESWNLFGVGVAEMQMRKLAVAVIFLALAGSTYAAARDRSHGHSRGHVRHSVAKPAKTPRVSSSEIIPAGSDRRDLEDLALDRKDQEHLPRLLMGGLATMIAHRAP